MSDTWTVLLPASIDPSGPAEIEAFATFVSRDEYADEAALRDDADRFDAVVVRVEPLDGAFFEAATNLQVVAKHGAGLDNVDVDAASRHSVVVCNTPGVNARAVAEHALTLALAVRRNVLPADREVRSGGWDRHEFVGGELRGATLGLFGFGNIARETAALAAGFGMDRLAYDPFVPAEEMPAGVEKVENPDELFERAGVVSVHTPLTEETRGAVSTAELAALGEDGIIVNTSRGGIVDESALVEALSEGTIAGAGIDVFEQEPPAADHPLFEQENAVLTPHLGGLTREALERMSRGAAENVRTVYEGGLPDSTVNPDRL